MCRETLLYLVARPTPDPPWLLALLDSARRGLGGGAFASARTEINSSRSWAVAGLAVPTQIYSRRVKQVPNPFHSSATLCRRCILVASLVAAAVAGQAIVAPFFFLFLASLQVAVRLITCVISGLSVPACRAFCARCWSLLFS